MIQIIKYYKSKLAQLVLYDLSNSTYGEVVLLKSQCSSLIPVVFTGNGVRQGTFSALFFWRTIL